MGVDLGDATAEGKRKEKKPTAQTPVTEAHSKRKSKKSKPVQEDCPGEVENVEPVKGETSKQRLKQHGGEGTVLEEAEGLKSHLGEVERQGKEMVDKANPVDEELGKKDNKKSGKRKRELDVAQSGASEHSSDREKKRKKRKKDKGQGVDEDDEQDKKRRNKTGFPDPNEDTSLSNQARKALAYAFAKFHQPSSWKFNKARQNWLIRNYWTKETIPETYPSLVTGYLANVQGGVRENLIAQCRAILEPPDTNSSPLADSSPRAPLSDEPTTPMGETEIKQIRGRALLEVLVSSREI